MADDCALNSPILRTRPLVWVLFAVLLFLLGYIFRDALKFLLMLWEEPEYGYAYMVPFISAFLIWQRKDRLARSDFSGSVWGVLTTGFGFLLFIAGYIGAVHSVMHYALVVVILGLFWSYMGIQAFRQVLVPLALLFFIIPLPGFLYHTLSNELQLLSSRIGVWLIRLFDISVYLEGNVIDLGSYKLQVIEACSGLRYLFPLMTLGFIMAYIFNAPLWKRAIIFLSTIPITVLMNSFRIGMIGILVEYWGPSMAEGFLHDFEGWIIFMACMAVLVLEMWLLTKLGRDKRPLRDIFGFEFPESPVTGVVTSPRKVPVTFIISSIMTVLVATVVYVLPDRREVIPERASFAEFPVDIGEWKGRGRKMESIYVDALNFDDYLLADYHNGMGDSINLYIGYYNTQYADKVPHSPKACLPGGGWVISDSTVRNLSNVRISGVPLSVNRVIIEKDNYKQLVYYWFQQRGRVVTSEYAVKYYLLLDAIKRHRTDGALVRLVAMIRNDEDVDRVDERLRGFAEQLAPVIPAYIPD